MKKLGRISALFLTAAVLISAFALVISANTAPTPSSVNSDYTKDDASDVSLLGGTTDSASISQVQEGSNTYTQFKYTGAIDFSGTSKPAFAAYEYLTWDSENSLTKFVVHEMDLSTDSQVPYSMSLTGNLRAQKSTNDGSGNLTFSGGELLYLPKYNILWFDRINSDGEFVLKGGSANATFSKDKWTRVSIVYEITRSESPVAGMSSEAGDVYDFSASRVHVFVNGVSIYSTSILNTEEYRYQTMSTIAYAWVGQVDFRGYSTSYKTADGDTICFDNTRLATYFGNGLAAADVVTESPSPVRGAEEAPSIDMTDNSSYTKDDGSDVAYHGSAGNVTETLAEQNGNSYTRLDYTSQVNIYSTSYPKFASSDYFAWDSKNSLTKYLVQEVDISTDSQVPYSMSFAGYLQADKATNDGNGNLTFATDSKQYVPKNNIFYFDNINSNGEFMLRGNSKAFTFSKNTWTRLSVVYEITRSESPVAGMSSTSGDVYDFSASKVYVFVNGELAYSANILNTDAYKYQTMTTIAHAWAGQLEFWGYSASYPAKAGDSICFDNTRFATGFSNVQDASLVVTKPVNPDRNAIAANNVASLNGTPVDEATLLETITATKDGTQLTVELLADLTVLLPAEGKNLTVKTADFAFPGFEYGKYNVAYESTENVYTVTAVSNENPLNTFGLAVNATLFTNYRLNYYVPTAELANIDSGSFEIYTNTAKGTVIPSMGKVNIDGVEHENYYIMAGAADASINTYYVGYTLGGAQCGFPVTYGLPYYMMQILTDGTHGNEAETLAVNMANYADSVQTLVGNADKSTVGTGAWIYSKMVEKYGDVYLTSYDNEYFIAACEDLNSGKSSEELALFESYVDGLTFSFDTNEPAFVLRYSEAGEAKTLWGGGGNLYSHATYNPSAGLYARIAYGTAKESDFENAYGMLYACPVTLSGSDEVLGDRILYTDYTGSRQEYLDNVYNSVTNAANYDYLCYFYNDWSNYWTGYWDSYANAVPTHRVSEIGKTITIELVIDKESVCTYEYSLAAYIASLAANGGDVNTLNAAKALYAYSLAADEYKQLAN